MACRGSLVDTWSCRALVVSEFRIAGAKCRVRRKPCKGMPVGLQVVSAVHWKERTLIGTGLIPVRHSSLVVGSTCIRQTSSLPAPSVIVLLLVYLLGLVPFLATLCQLSVVHTCSVHDAYQPSMPHRELKTSQVTESHHALVRIV